MCPFRPKTQAQNLVSPEMSEAEVLWILRTVAHHQSYCSNDDVGELFVMMFPDSDIAKSISCGADKSAYAVKHGLASHLATILNSE